MISFAANVLCDDCLKFTWGSETFSLDLVLKYNTLYPLFCPGKEFKQTFFCTCWICIHMNMVCKPPQSLQRLRRWRIKDKRYTFKTAWFHSWCIILSAVTGTLTLYLPEQKKLNWKWWEPGHILLAAHCMAHRRCQVSVWCPLFFLTDVR